MGYSPLFFPWFGVPKAFFCLFSCLNTTTFTSCKHDGNTRQTDSWSQRTLDPPVPVNLTTAVSLPTALGCNSHYSPFMNQPNPSESERNPRASPTGVGNVEQEQQRQRLVKSPAELLTLHGRPFSGTRRVLSQSAGRLLSPC